MSTDNPEDIVDDYTDVLADGDFHLEYKRGQNGGRHLSPKEMQDLLDLRLQQEAIESRRTSGIFRQIAD